MLTVGQLMWTGIAPVAPATPVKEVAALLAARGIPGVPVVDGEGVAIGMVFEDGLLDPGGRRTRARGREGQSLTAADVMASPAVGVRAIAPMSLVAELLVERPCLPVLRDGRPVGLVGRAAVAYALSLPDVELAKEVESALALGCGVPRGTLHVAVDGGRVALRGPSLPRRMERDLPLVVGALFGVTSLEVQLGATHGRTARRARRVRFRSTSRPRRSPT